MKNIVTFEISTVSPVSVIHNNKKVYTTTDSNFTIELECVEGTNILELEGAAFDVIDISMFNMANELLLKEGNWQKQHWTIEYTYPVFSYLHKLLKHGWLIKSD